MKHKRAGFACVADLRYIYVFGGVNEDNEKLASAERYDILRNRWEDLPDMPGGGRAYCAAGIFFGEVHVVGGVDEDGNNIGSTVVYHTWSEEYKLSPSEVPRMNLAREGLSVVGIGGFAIAIGGFDEDAGSTIERICVGYDPAWTVLPREALPGNDRFYAGVAGYCKSTNEIIVAGGFGRSKSAVGISDSLSLGEREFSDNFAYF